MFLETTVDIHGKNYKIILPCTEISLMEDYIGDFYKIKIGLDLSSLNDYENNTVFFNQYDVSLHLIKGINKDTCLFDWDDSICIETYIDDFIRVIDDILYGYVYIPLFYNIHNINDLITKCNDFWRYSKSPLSNDIIETKRLIKDILGE